MVTAVYGVAQLQAQRYIAIDAIDHGARDAFAVGNFGQDVTPHRGVVAPAVVEHDDTAGVHIVDVITHGAGH